MNEQKEFDERVVRYFHDQLSPDEKTIFLKELDKGSDQALIRDFETYAVLYGVAKQIGINEGMRAPDKRLVHDADLLERERHNQLTTEDRRELEERKDDSELEELRQTYILLEGLEEPTDSERELVFSVLRGDGAPERREDKEIPQRPGKVRSLLNRRFLPVLSVAAASLLLLVAVGIWKLSPATDKVEFITHLEAFEPAEGALGFAVEAGVDTLKALADQGNYDAAYRLMSSIPLPNDREGEAWDNYVKVKGRILLGEKKPAEAVEWLQDNLPTYKENGGHIAHGHLLALALLMEKDHEEEALIKIRELENDSYYFMYPKKEYLARLKEIAKERLK